jgi:sensor histidine kinase regulating citrate/malate metabolism
MSLGDRKMNKGAAVIIVVLAGLLIACLIALSVTNKRLNLERQEKVRLEAELNALSEELRAATGGMEMESEAEGESVEGEGESGEGGEK